MSFTAAETPTTGLGDYIKNSRLLVPTNQRDYKWKQDYIEQFVDDVVEAMTNNDDEFFCGLMVFVRSEDRAYDVLDGQQRLATTLILYSAIRNWLSLYTEYEQFGDQIQTTFLGEPDLGERTPIPKLRLNSANDPLFQKYVVGSGSLEEARSELGRLGAEHRNRPLLESVLTLHRIVSDFVSQQGEPDQAKNYLLRLAKYLREQVRIVVLAVDNEDTAYTVFETLNDRGMELAPLDLVKNHLFRQTRQKSAAERKAMEDRWTEMMAILSNSKPDAFLRAFWASRHGAPGTAKLFKPFKSAYADAAQCFEVSVRLRSVSEHYVAVSDPEDAAWASHSDATKDHIEGLATVGSTQFHPIILSALERDDLFDRKEMERLVRLIEVLAVRYSLIQRGRPGRIESLGARAAKNILSGDIVSASALRKELDELYIDDESFEANFATFEEGTSKKSRFLLRRLEQEARKRQEQAHSTELAPAQVTVEHIMPKRPNSWWQSHIGDENEEFHEQYINRLGNMCLLSTINSKLGNKDFPAKKDAYSKSGLILTKKVAGYEDWRGTQIDNRQKYLAGLAVSHWRFD